jgi:hypothetical protein
MEKYNYREAVCEDIRNYLQENDIFVTQDNKDDLEDALHDKLWVEYSATGNASGSYTCNTWQAEENLCHNLDLLAEAIDEFGADAGTYRDALESAETADVTIRCYLLRECLSKVLSELAEDDYEE